MQRIFSVLKQTFRNSILIVTTFSLLILSSLFIFAAQPSYAAVPNEKLIQQEKMDKLSETVHLQPPSYEEEVEAEKNPEKVYEDNLKEYKKANPDEGIVEKAVEGTKDLVNKVTGK